MCVNNQFHVYLSSILPQIFTDVLNNYIEGEGKKCRNIERMELQKKYEKFQNWGYTGWYYYLKSSNRTILYKLYTLD